jgi:hypothetical protein
MGSIIDLMRVILIDTQPWFPYTYSYSFRVQRSRFRGSRIDINNVFANKAISQAHGTYTVVDGG